MNECDGTESNYRRTGGRVEERKIATSYRIVTCKYLTVVLKEKLYIVQSELNHSQNVIDKLGSRSALLADILLLGNKGGDKYGLAYNSNEPRASN